MPPPPVGASAVAVRPASRWSSHPAGRAAGGSVQAFTGKQQPQGRGHAPGRAAGAAPRRAGAARQRAPLRGRAPSRVRAPHAGAAYGRQRWLVPHAARSSPEDVAAAAGHVAHLEMAGVVGLANLLWFAPLPGGCKRQEDANPPPAILPNGKRAAPPPQHARKPTAPRRPPARPAPALRRAGTGPQGERGKRGFEARAAHPSLRRVAGVPLEDLEILEGQPAGAVHGQREAQVDGADLRAGRGKGRARFGCVLRVVVLLCFALLLLWLALLYYCNKVVCFFIVACE